MINEIRPGLWIGNLLSINQLDQLYQVDSKYIESKDHGRSTGSGYTGIGTIRWTIITLSNDTKLLQFVRTILQSRYPKDTVNNNKTSHSVNIIEHIEWELTDSIHANFVSFKLLQILEAIHKVLNPINCKYNNLEQYDGPQRLQTDQGVQNACLVHCVQGISRSSAVIAAYLLYSKECTTMEDALHTIRTIQPTTQPNLGFIAGLRAIEQCSGNINLAITRMNAKLEQRTNNDCNVNVCI